jgi:hypothetical protein
MLASGTDLLSLTRTLLRATFWFNLFMVVLLACILVALFIGHPEQMTIATRLAVPPEQRLFAARMAVAGGLLACVLLAPLLRLLLRIVDSTRDGDPFVPENGARLRRIGVLLLGMNIAIDACITVALRGHIGFPPVSFTAILTVLMVFVIARIFDVGSAMRAELKETV